MFRSVRLRYRLRCSRSSYRCRRVWRHSMRWAIMGLNTINRRCRSGMPESSRKKAGRGPYPASISITDHSMGTGFAVAPPEPCPLIIAGGGGSSMPHHTTSSCFTFFYVLYFHLTTLYLQGGYVSHRGGHLLRSHVYLVLLFVLVHSSRILMISRRYGLASLGFPHLHNIPPGSEQDRVQSGSH